MPAPNATRRELLCGGVLATVGASVLLRPAAAAAAAIAPAPTDAEVLLGVLGIEQLVVIGYRDALGSGVLSAGMSRQLGGLLSQELEHVAILERELRARNATVPAQPTPAVAQVALLRHHIRINPQQLRSQRQWLRLLIDLESLAEGAYFSAISKLQDSSLLRTSAEIMGSEAQHWTALSATQHHGDVGKSVPYPFVQGSP